MYPGEQREMGMDKKVEETCKDFLSGAVELLSELINKNIEIAGFMVDEVSTADIGGMLEGDMLVIPVKLEGDIECTNAFLLSQSLAVYLAEAMMGEEPSGATELSDSAKANATEAFSQLAVVIAMYLSMNLNTNIQSKLEDIQFGFEPDYFSGDGDKALLASLNLAINGFSEKLDYLIPESMIAIFEKMTKDEQIIEETPSAAAESVQQEDVEEPVIDITERAGDMVIEEPEAEEMNDVSVSGKEQTATNEEEPTEKIAFEPLEPSPGTQSSPNIDLLMDVPLDVTVELGRTRMLVKDVLEITEGSIIELNKLAGEPVEFYVNGKLISKGEVVVIDENFGVRITEIISPVERITSLNP